MLTKRKNKICRSQNKHNDDYFNEIDKIGDERWEMDDPSPDIEWLYRGFNKHLFNGALPTDIKVKWSQELGTTAGQYLWFKKIIELNESLLKYRSRRNMVEILLVINTFHNWPHTSIDNIYPQHEMIHVHVRDDEAHSNHFKMIMHDLNQKTNLNMTV